MKINNRKIGYRGEQVAADFLADKGYEILERNYREIYGEIDIVVRKSEKRNEKLETVVVFVEVKTKTEEMFGEPWEMINKHKIKQITQMGHLWCMENHYRGLLRIDVVGVWLDQLGEVVRIEHWENVVL